MTGQEERAAPLVFLITGEPSGDLLGARLIAALKTRNEGLRIAGVGGERMAAEGLKPLFPMADLTVMGLAELAPRLPLILRRLNETVAEIRRLRPDVIVTIDAPDFCFRVAKRVRDTGIPLIHYVAPTVWAWRPGRAAKIARFLDHLLTLLPFEPPYFEREGLSTTFVGHPILEGGARSGDGPAFRQRHAVKPTERLITILPGSRHSETRRLLPIFKETLGLLTRRYPDLMVVVPTVATVSAEVRAEVGKWPVRSVIVEGDREKYDAFAASEVALAASGTVAVELAIASLPAIIAYRVHPLTAGLYRRFIKVKYANLINILLDRPVVPEFLQEACRPELLADAVASLLEDPGARALQQAAGQEAARLLGSDGASPSERAADVVCQVLARRSTDVISVPSR